jgi:hypothetical protein
MECIKKTFKSKTKNNKKTQARKNKNTDRAMAQAV